MRIAFVSDIHGNLPALEAVAADIHRRGADRVVNLGDNLSGPLLPRETAQWLMASDWLSLAGNHERQVLQFFQIEGTQALVERHAGVFQPALGVGQVTTELLLAATQLGRFGALGLQLGVHIQQGPAKLLHLVHELGIGLHQLGRARACRRAGRAYNSVAARRRAPAPAAS